MLENKQKKRQRSFRSARWRAQNQSIYLLVVIRNCNSGNTDKCGAHRNSSCNRRIARFGHCVQRTKLRVKNETKDTDKCVNNCNFHQLQHGAESVRGYFSWLHVP